jgi:hypothetical protein
MHCAPIAFFIFNRPELTARTFAAIRKARPPVLLLIADGPRADQPNERDVCARVRAVVREVDWSCEVLRNFADDNMGCGKRLASGLAWTFGQVEEAIILEDDCLPDPSFFPYCTELLERYRAEERVMMISGNNFQNGTSRTSDSYYFSRFPHIWGWAGWRRAWLRYDFTLAKWPPRRQTGWLAPVVENRALERYWTQCLDGVLSGTIDTWDYQWMHCMFIHEGLAIAPNVNLVTNIGFGPGATHTLAGEEIYSVPRRAMAFPLRHPATMTPNAEADHFEIDYLYPFLGSL